MRDLYALRANVRLRSSFPLHIVCILAERFYCMGNAVSNTIKKYVILFPESHTLLCFFTNRLWHIHSLTQNQLSRPADPCVISQFCQNKLGILI